MSEGEEPSYLPSWVLRMRRKIEESRQAHSVAEDRIGRLNEGVKALDSKLAELHVHSPSSQAAPSQEVTATGRTVTAGASLYVIPPDMLLLVLDFLDLLSSCRVATLVAKALTNLIDTTSFWTLRYREEFPFLATSSPTEHHARRRVSDYMLKTLQCTKFVQAVKSQRGVPKHKQIQPRRFSRSETSVSHPLAMTGRSEDLVMSFSESLNTDFRSFAHQTLELLACLSSSADLDRFYRQLVDDGVIAVLVSLLANEEAAVQNYSCCILANLLHWDHHTQPRLGIAQQLRACSGQRPILELLTSPSACINLSTSCLSAPTATARRTASVQGVCNKSASRALVSLFFPAATVGGEAAISVASNLFLPLEADQAFEVCYFHKSGGLKDSCRTLLCSLGDQRVGGAGMDAIGRFAISGRLERDIAGGLLIFHKTYLRDGEAEPRSVGAHVSHIAYWQGDGRRDGLWGVWETNVGEPHFELKRGGVFRAVPV